MPGYEPSPLISSIGRHTLKLRGDFILRMHPRPDHVPTIRLELKVTSSASRTTPLSSGGYRYPPVEFPVTRLSELRQLIVFSNLLNDPLITSAGGFYDVLGFVTDVVTAYFVDRMEGRFSAPVNTLPIHRIRASLKVAG